MKIEEIKTIKDIKGIFINIFPIFFKTKNKFGILSLCVYRIPKINKKIINKYLYINEEKHQIKTLFNKGLKILSFKNYSYYINIYKATIDPSIVINYKVQNLVTMFFECDKEKELIMPIVYNLPYYKKYLGKSGPLFKYKENDLVCYFRQANMNSLAITIRKKNITDKLSNRILLFMAWFLSIFLRKSKNVFIYEKENNRYEESGAAVYERLIDLGYKNVYFVLNKNSGYDFLIKDKYLKNIIWSHTFKHYLSFFRGNKFIGTEALSHMLELRTKSACVLRKLSGNNFRYVFLQHGVMYMISLDSPTRSSFRKGKNLPKDTKIVVSSKKEADHFVDLGGFENSDLYVTGLPLYDRMLMKKPDADKIVIMITWRQWEYLELEVDYQNTSYYKMIENIFNSIPEKYKNKVQILPHPLVLESFLKTDLKEYIPDILIFDQILENTDLLITDYSSLAYSAFYRGSNVIFCWEELEECMARYQAHLMLNESNTFGDISFNYSDIPGLIEKNYLKDQTELHKKNYKEIVEFDDNKNTDRLIESLKKDKMI